MAWSEQTLRQYLWANRAEWSTILEPLPPDVEKPTDLDVSTLEPRQLLWELARRRLVRTDEHVRGLSLLAEELRLGKSKDRMFVDLFGVPFELGAPGLAIIELKVARQTSRESFTELLGYGQALGGLFPGLSRDDLLHVLVAPMSDTPPIVRSALVAALIFDRRRIVAYEPVFDFPTTGAVRLRPWIPAVEDLAILGRVAFRAETLVVEKQVWAETEGCWHETAMNNIATRAALAMECSGIHGFAYTTKAWPELNMPLPNSLVCVAINPFELAHALFLISRKIPIAELWHSQLTNLKLSEIIEHLNPRADTADADDLANLAAAWSSHIRVLAHDAVQRATQRCDGSLVTIDQGSFTWDQYLSSSIESEMQTDYGLVPTGLVRELYDLVIELDYAQLAGGKHPLHGGDPFLHAEEMQRSHGDFQEFLKRMAQPYGSLADGLTPDE